MTAKQTVEVLKSIHGEFSKEEIDELYNCLL